jgi:hypothetical protein
MAGTLKLYYLPGSCALAPHIALEHAGASNTCLRSVMSSVSICPSSRSASVESERSTSFGIRRVRRISFRKVITAQGLHKWGRPKGPWTSARPFPFPPDPSVGRAARSCLCFVAGLGRGMHALHSNIDAKAYAASVGRPRESDQAASRSVFW